MDPFVSRHIAATHGRMYAHLAGRLGRYPIPGWPWSAVQDPEGKPAVLDLGCGWGRWALAAANAGYRAVGVDRSLEAVRAARRVARELGREGETLWVCADVDRLPFRAETFAEVVAYGVWQYLPGQGCGALREAQAVLHPGGQLRVQLPHRGGLRARLFRRLARWGKPLEQRVQYWTLAQMRDLGATAGAEPQAGAERPRLHAEGYFSTNAQWEDRDLLPLRYRCLVAASRLLCRCSRRWPALLMLADAVWVDLPKAP